MWLVSRVTVGDGKIPRWPGSYTDGPKVTGWNVSQGPLTAKGSSSSSVAQQALYRWATKSNGKQSMPIFILMRLLPEGASLTRRLEMITLFTNLNLRLVPSTIIVNELTTLLTWHLLFAGGLGRWVSSIKQVQLQTGWCTASRLYHLEPAQAHGSNTAVLCFADQASGTSSYCILKCVFVVTCYYRCYRM